MKPKHAHLTINGRPLCDFGMWGDSLMHEHGVRCGSRSVAAALRAKKALQKHVCGVKVVVGDCPVGARAGATR